MRKAHNVLFAIAIALDLCGRPVPYQNQQAQIQRAVEESMRGQFPVGPSRRGLEKTKLFSRPGRLAVAAQPARIFLGQAPEIDTRPEPPRVCVFPPPRVRHSGNARLVLQGTFVLQIRPYFRRAEKVLPAQPVGSMQRSLACCNNRASESGQIYDRGTEHTEAYALKKLDRHCP